MGFFDGTPKKQARYYDSPNVDPNDPEGKGKASKVDKQLRDAVEFNEYSNYLNEVGADDGFEADMAREELGEAESIKTAHQDSLVSYLRKRDFQRLNPNIEGSPSKVTTSLDVTKPSRDKTSIPDVLELGEPKDTPLRGTVAGENKVVQATKTGLRDESIRQSSVLFDYIGERSDLTLKYAEQDLIEEPINRTGNIPQLEQLNNLETKFFGPEGSAARSKAMAAWLDKKGHRGVNPDVMLQHVEDAITSESLGYKSSGIHDIGTSKHLTTSMNRIKSITDPTLPSERWSMEQQEFINESDGWHIPQEGWTNEEIAEHEWELESSDQAQHHNQMADDVEDLRTGGSLGGPKTEDWYSGKTKAEIESSLKPLAPASGNQPTGRSLVKEFLQDNRKYLDWASGKGVPSKGLGKDVLERVIKSLP